MLFGTPAGSDGPLPAGRARRAGHNQTIAAAELGYAIDAKLYAGEAREAENLAMWERGAAR